MSEYPTRHCGPCPHLAHFENVEKKDYLTTNSLPEPRIEFSNAPKFGEQNLGVGSTDLNPNLGVSPIKEVKFDEKVSNNAEKYKGGIPPCDTRQPIGDGKGCCLTGEPSKKPIENCCCTRIVSAEQETAAPRRGILKYQPEARPAPEPIENMHATAGRTPPHSIEPSSRPPVPNDLRPVPEGNVPCYLPQPQDSLPHPIDTEMGPIGPWATGRVDWGPLSGLTGTRPVVDKYSIARYSEGDWRAHNKNILDMSSTEQHRANLIDWNGRQCLEQTQADTDKNQEDNTKRLNQRELEIHRWKCELERAIAASAEEIGFMEEQRRRLKQASSVLTMPESISGECLERRTGRMDSELVRDEVEDELIREVALCAEIRDIFSRTLKDVEKQLIEDKTIKQRLEYDWSDKKVAHEIDAINMAFNNRSNVLLFKPGAVCFPEEQSTPEYWEHFTRETLLEGEATRQRSATLRGTLDAILNNAARDLRSQADRVEMALARRIACTQEVTNRLENELKQVLRRLADVEDLKDALRNAIRRMDTPMKKAQTRLDNRLNRPRVENCRDVPHFGLVEEVKSIGESVAALQAQMNQAEESQGKLIQARSDLEREIMLKRKTLEIDNDRTKRIRSYYPSATALSGY
ncbi:tektin A [Leptinotarsa decemlineata]|uniref:tektin A n=1 Tax=Leptinotarsa decemlineata TaxID=7539 RepID=UPI000C251AB0|nr:tektin-4 [Leptinotarsa decemlineata]